MTHDIPEDVKNSNLEYCINEYVRKTEHRDMLRERWFDGMTIEEIAARHHMSVTCTKDIVWRIGDKVMLRALKMEKNG